MPRLKLFFLFCVVTLMMPELVSKAGAQIQRGPNIFGEAPDDNSGWSVSMPDSNTVAIGAIHNSSAGFDAGHVRVYEWINNSWVQKGADIDGESPGDWSGYCVDMPHANTVAIGSPANGNYTGQVRIFSWNGSAWLQKGLDINGEAIGDQAGWSLSMPDSNTVAIGAPLNSPNATSAGHVRVFIWDGNSWMQKGADIDGVTANEQSGYNVSMPDSNTVAIAAPLIGAGQARIFVWNGSMWVQKGSSIDGELPLDYSGRSLSMPDANTIAIGAPGNDNNMGTDAGHARVYRWNGNAWNQKGAEIDGMNSNDLWGLAVDMPDSNTLAIGSSFAGNANFIGEVRLYVWNGISWVQKGQPMEGDSSGVGLGSSVSMPDTNTVAIGAPAFDGNGIDGGLVRIFSFGNYSTGLSPELNSFRDGLKIYLNSEDGKVLIRFESLLSQITIVIRNILGQEMASYVIYSATEIQFKIPNVSGMQIIELTADNKTTVFKLVHN